MSFYLITLLHFITTFGILSSSEAPAFPNKEPIRPSRPNGRADRLFSSRPQRSLKTQEPASFSRNPAHARCMHQPQFSTPLDQSILYANTRCIQRAWWDHRGSGECRPPITEISSAAGCRDGPRHRRKVRARIDFRLPPPVTPGEGWGTVSRLSLRQVQRDQCAERVRRSAPWR